MRTTAAFDLNFRVTRMILNCNLPYWLVLVQKSTLYTEGARNSTKQKNMPWNPIFLAHR